MKLVEIFCSFSYSLAQLRALGVRYLMLLLAARQEVAKKRAKTFLLGSPFPCRTTKKIKRDYIKIAYAVLQVLPPRAAGGKAKSFLFKFLVVIGRVAGGKNFFCRILRASFVSVFFFKTPTQKLKVQNFAQT